MVLEITHGVQTCLCQQVRRDHANSVKRATWGADAGNAARSRSGMRVSPSGFKVARQFGEELVEAIPTLAVRERDSRMVRLSSRASGRAATGLLRDPGDRGKGKSRTSR